MDEVLLEIGLSEKEAQLYLALLAKPRQSAQQLAVSCDIRRTNVYHILDTLLMDGLVVSDDSPVRQFSASDPRILKELLQRKQTQLKQASSSLATTMPQFISQYSLALDKPGVFHMAGNEGFEQLLRDMVRSKTEILLVASDYVPQDPDMLSRLRELQLARLQAGVHTRALFHGASSSNRLREEFGKRGIETRLIGETPFSGEVAIYEDNVAFTTYSPSLVVTIITNAHIATTLRLMFEQLWEKAA